MTKPIVYGMGYTGKQLDDLIGLARKLDAVIVDIRFSPLSRNPQFRKYALERALGTNYTWLKAFGNRNYKGGPIEIEAYAEGRDWLEKQGGNVILMCACGDPSHCHRTTILQRLAEDGFETHELDHPKPKSIKPKQLLLL